MTVTLHEGDCRSVLASLPDASVQMCLTSPPYFGLRDYGADGQIGLEKTPAEYVAELVAVFREVRRVLRDDGTLWLNLGDSYAQGGSGGASSKSTLKNDGRKLIGARNAEQRLNEFAFSRKPPPGLKPKDLIGIPWRVAFALQEDGWWLRSDIVWAKPSCMPESVRDRPTRSHEYIFMLSKSARYFYDAEAIAEVSVMTPQRPLTPAKLRKAVPGQPEHTGDKGLRDIPQPDRASRNARSVWTIPTEPSGLDHYAIMPTALAERCIKAGTSERGCCPSCGASWARVTERGESDCARLKGARDWREIRAQQAKRGHDQNGRTGKNTLTAKGTVPSLRSAPSVAKGWSPACHCPPHEPVPCTVLDPFGGVGTTGLVADRLGRHAILIELNPKSVDLARERIVGDSPLFAEVA